MKELLTIGTTAPRNGGQPQPRCNSLKAPAADALEFLQFAMAERMVVR